MNNVNPQTQGSYTNIGTQAGGLNFAQSEQDFQTAQGGMSFKDQLKNMVPNQDFALLNGTKEVDELLKDVDFANILTLGSVNMKEKDAQFFLALIENNRKGEIALNHTPSIERIMQNYTAEEIVKSSQVSKTLLDLISQSNSTNKPVRIDFDNDITVVLRVDREGKLSAQFFPGDKAAEEYLKNNILQLRQKFDEQNLPYKELSYRGERGHKEEQQQEQKHKENKNE